jgi:hypothetical protein
MSWAVYGTIFRITPESGASFTVTGGFMNAAIRSLEMVPKVFLKLVSVFKEASKNLVRYGILIFLEIRTPKQFNNHQRIYRKYCLT